MFKLAWLCFIHGSLNWIYGWAKAISLDMLFYVHGYPIIHGTKALFLDMFCINNFILSLHGKYQCKANVSGHVQHVYSTSTPVW